MEVALVAADSIQIVSRVGSDVDNVSVYACSSFSVTWLRIAMTGIRNYTHYKCIHRHKLTLSIRREEYKLKILFMIFTLG